MKLNIILSNKLSWGGLAKVALDRFRVYASYILLFWTWEIRDSVVHDGLDWKYLLLILGSLAVIFVDIRYMLRGEQQAMFEVHPYFPEMKKNIEEIKKELQELKLQQLRKAYDLPRLPKAS